MNKSRCKILINSVVTGLTSLFLFSTTAMADTAMWRIGKADNSGTEFTAASGTVPPATYAIPSDWATRTSWPEWPSSTGGSSAMCSDISFNVGAVPANGAQFIFKTTWANDYAPELAVFCNGNPCGIIEIAGGTGWAYGSTAYVDFRKTYQVTIPKEFFTANSSNTLRIQKLGAPYQRSLYMGEGFGWDYFELDSLSSHATEPINGKLTYMGVANGSFAIDTGHVNCEEAADKWMGVAFCGNPQRATFWDNVVSQQPNRVQYLQKLRDLMMTPILDGWDADASKSLSSGQSYVGSLFSQYGNLINYYELCNEPTMANESNGSLSNLLGIAQYINGIKPAAVKLAAPAYAYGGGSGTPLNWDDSSANGIANRKQLESYCDATNGHTYGSDLWNPNHNGQFYATCDTYSVNNQLLEGLPKEMINTECGTGDNQTDFFDVRNGSNGNSPWRESMYDRNIRAEISYVDRFCSFAFSGGPQILNFIRGASATTGISDAEKIDPTTWVARNFSNYGQYTDFNGDTRVKLFRRLALAYATHGQPLPYVYTNPAQIANKLVYFRAVDASKLAPLPNTGATSNKILLSFVNNDLNNSNTISVTVTMPTSGTYIGERIGPQPKWSDADTQVSKLASPQLTLTENLGPGESVEYIFNTISAPETTYGNSGNPWPIPGTIQAENYDTGGQNVGYYDTTAGNNGSVYRNDDVDITPCSDAGGGYQVGWTVPGEWLNYTVNVASTAAYSFQVRESSGYNANSTVHIEIDGVNVTNPITLPPTGAYTTYTTVSTSGINLTAGRHTMRVYFDAGYADLNSINIVPAAPTNGWYRLTPGANANSCLDVQYGASADQTPVWEYGYNGNFAQKWYLTNVNNSGWYRLMPGTNSNSCLDVKQANAVDWQPVWEYTYNGNDAQLWSFTPLNAATYRITTKLNPNMVLDVYYGNSTDQTPIQVYHWIDSAAQHWTLVPVTGP